MDIYICAEDRKSHIHNFIWGFSNVYKYFSGLISHGEARFQVFTNNTFLTGRKSINQNRPYAKMTDSCATLEFQLLSIILHTGPIPTFCDFDEDLLPNINNFEEAIHSQRYGSHKIRPNCVAGFGARERNLWLSIHENEQCMYIIHVSRILLWDFT